jgi:hypothetical protein
MKFFRRSGLVAGVLALTACGREKSPPPIDSSGIRARAVTDSASALAASTTRNWDASAGPVLLVAGAFPAQAIIVPPDSANGAAELAGIPRQATVTLFGRGGTVQNAEVASVVDTTGCAVATISASPPPRPWSVGFIGGVVAPLALDSTESLSRSDSAVFVTDMTRLASSLPNDSAGRFAGLPFVVRSVWRFAVTNGPQVVIATLARQINQEATPLREHTLIVAERSSTDSAFTLAYSERSFGAEETIESRDVLAAAMIGRTPALILSRDYGDATAYGLIQRGEDGRWRSRWLSARRHC